MKRKARKLGFKQVMTRKVWRGLARRGADKVTLKRRHD